MKTALLSILIVLCSGITLMAQTSHRFADSTAQWNVLQIHWIPSGLNNFNYQTDIYQPKGDTVIGGKLYQKIIRNGLYFSNVIRKDTANKVYALNNNNEEHLIYDFGGNKGDTIHFPPTWWHTEDSAYCTVDSVDTVNMVHPRKRMFVTYHLDASATDIWIDGIGSTQSHFLNPQDTYICCDGPVYVLLCYFENDSLLHHDNIYADCTLDSTTVVGISEIDKNAISILPNPATEKSITIQSEAPLPSQSIFQLFDLTGRMILQQPLTDKTTQIQLHDASKGMYLYNIAASRQNISTGKILIE